MANHEQLALLTRPSVPDRQSASPELLRQPIDPELVMLAVNDRIQNHLPLDDLLQRPEIALDPVANRFCTLMQQSFADVAANNPQLPSETAARIARIEQLTRSLLQACPTLAQKKEKKKYDIANMVNDVLNLQELQGRLLLASPEEKLKQFKKYQLEEYESLLGEMYGVHDKTTKLSVRNGHVYFDTLSKDKPFDETMAFFVAWSEHVGTNESLRHLAELYAMVQIDHWAQTAEAGATYSMVSSQGVAKGSRYDKRYEDGGILRIDQVTGERYIELTRFKSPSTHQEYIANLSKRNPRYARKSALPIDAVLFEPEFHKAGEYASVQDLHAAKFRRHPDAISRAVFINEILNSQDVDDQGQPLSAVPQIIEYIERLCSNPTWTDLSLAYDAMLVASQKAWDHYQQKQQANAVPSYRSIIPAEVVYDERMRAGDQKTNTLATQTFRPMSAGCNGIEGLGLGADIMRMVQQQSIEYVIEQQTALSIVNTFLDNSVAQDVIGQLIEELSLWDDLGFRLVKCDACKYQGPENKRPYNGFISKCRNPNYCPDRSAVVCDNPKTKETQREEEEVVEEQLQENEKLPEEDKVSDAWVSESDDVNQKSDSYTIFEMHMYHGTYAQLKQQGEE